MAKNRGISAAHTCIPQYREYSPRVPLSHAGVLQSPCPPNELNSTLWTALKVNGCFEFTVAMIGFGQYHCMGATISTTVIEWFVYF